MKRLLANENFSIPSVRLLRAAGFGVLSIAEDHFSIDDRAVMQLAIAQNRAILTHDRDYGELVFRFKFRPPAGVIYYRLKHYLPHKPAEILFSLLENPDFQIEGRFTVIDSPVIVRQRII